MRKPSGDENVATEESAAHRVAALLRADAIEAVDEQRHHTAWEALLLDAQRSDERRLRSPRAGRRWLAVSVAVSLGALALAGGSMFRASVPRPLTFQIDGRRPADAQLASGAEETRQLDFSDGSRLVLRPSGRLRVLETNADGAALVLESGELEAAVRHRASTRWRLSVGPYTVKVTGTRFKASWDPSAAEIRVDTLEGSVTVEGPGVTRPVVVARGEQFRASSKEQRRGAVQLSADSEPPRPASSPSPLPPSAATPSSKHVASLSAASRGRRLEGGACRWDDLLAMGQFQPIVAEARATGVNRVLTECPPRSLFAVADAARYRGDFDLSRGALLAIRRRSPPDAGKAAFFLGRVEEALGNYELAWRWYSEAVEAHLESVFLSEARAAKVRVGQHLPAQHRDAGR